MILRGVQGRRDRACDQLLSRRRQLARKREEDPLLSLPGNLRTKFWVLVRAMRNVTEPTRPSSALLTIPSSLLPPLLLSRLPLYRTAQLHLLLFSPLPHLHYLSLFSLNLIFSLPHSLSFVVYRSRPDLTRDLYSLRETISEDISAVTRGIKDNQNPLTRRPILRCPRS